MLDLAGLGRAVFIAKGAQPTGQAVGFCAGDRPLLGRQTAHLERSHRPLHHRQPLLNRRLKPSRNSV
jgi:hypothetical protein